MRVSSACCLLASRKLSDQQQVALLSVADERDMVIQGLLTFLDPPKESAQQAIAALQENGVTVKVLTSDNPVGYYLQNLP